MQRLFLCCLLASLSLILPSGASTENPDFKTEQPVAVPFNHDEIKALKRRALENRKHVTIRDKGGNLNLSGEVRTEFRATNEKRNGIKQRGRGGIFSEIPMYNWDIELNMTILSRITLLMMILSRTMTLLIAHCPITSPATL